MLSKGQIDRYSEVFQGYLSNGLFDCARQLIDQAEKDCGGLRLPEVQIEKFLRIVDLHIQSENFEKAIDALEWAKRERDSTKSTFNELLDAENLSVNDLGLPPRTIGMLYSKGIETAGEFLKVSRGTVLSWNNWGERTYKSVIEAINKKTGKG